MALQLVMPVPRDQLGRRLLQVLIGFLLFGFSIALLVEADLGLDPWDVLHQGASVQTGLSIGNCTIAIGVLVLLLWIPLRQRLGLGTISNAILIGIAVDVSLVWLPSPDTMLWRVDAMVAGIVLNGLATGIYIGAGLGPGPRDGLMTGLAARGHSIRVVRTSIEIAVLISGWLLGGSVGVGTVAYALMIGPIAHVTVPAFTVGKAAPAVPPEAHTSSA